MSKASSRVITLIAAPGRVIAADILAMIGRAVNARESEVRAERAVADIFTPLTIPEAQKAVRATIGAQPIDYLIQDEECREKNLLVADMESTIIQQEMLDELAKAIGMGGRVSEITRRAMNGELDFAAALRERVILLKGQPVSLLQDVAARITLMPGAEALLKMMHDRGSVSWLISGGFMCFAEPVAAKLGFTHVIANDLLTHQGMITGEVAEPILDKDRKRELLLQAALQHEIDLSRVLAVGDGANDIPMLTACDAGGGLGVAYHAKPKVREIIAQQINFGDLHALIAAQGY